MTKFLKICVVSTAVHNSVILCEEFKRGVKFDTEPYKDMAAGVGLNAAIAAYFTASIENPDRPVHIKFICELGAASPDNYMRYALNKYLKKDLTRIGAHPKSKFEIIDLAEDNPDITVPSMAVLIEKAHNGDRSIAQIPSRLLCNYNVQSRSIIDSSVRWGDVLILNSRGPYKSSIAANAAHEAEIPIVLDYNSEASSFKKSPFLRDILLKTTHMLVPAEATIYRRLKEPNRERLTKILVNSFGKNSFIAISDGGKPVESFLNQIPQDVFLPPDFRVKNPEKNGSGDFRTGAFGALIGGGTDALTALKRASCGATASGNYTLRDWLDPENRDSFLDALNEELKVVPAPI